MGNCWPHPLKTARFQSSVRCSPAYYSSTMVAAREYVIYVVTKRDTGVGFIPKTTGKLLERSS